jgi:hypothetical protein
MSKTGLIPVRSSVNETRTIFWNEKQIEPNLPYYFEFKTRLFYTFFLTKSYGTSKILGIIFSLLKGVEKHNFPQKTGDL